jgi:hypothetical protein
VSDDVHEVYAITYAQVDRRSPDNFLGGDPHDVPMPLNYYVWLVVGGGRTIAVDTGFDQRGAELRRRKITKPVREGLTAFGVDLAAVEDVIITHLHYDHCGNDGLFPAARYHLQEAEMAYATGRCMGHPVIRVPFEVEDVVDMVRRVYAAASSSTTARPRSSRASRCTISAAIRAGSRRCGSRPGAAMSCSPRTSLTSTPTSTSAVPIR